MEYETCEYMGYTIHVEYSHYPDNPREWSNLGIMACAHPRYDLGDEDGARALVEAVRSSRDYRPSWDRDTDWGHLPDVHYRALQCRDIILLPLYLYDHSGITMNTTGFTCPWDSGMVGCIFITRAKVCEEYGVKRVSRKLRAKVEGLLRAEVDVYDAYLRGEVFTYRVEKDGETIDCVGGFYDPEECLAEAKACVLEEK